MAVTMHTLTPVYLAHPLPSDLDHDSTKTLKLPRGE